MTHEELIKEYPYLYETHMHTSEGSKCGKNSGAEMARAYKAAGYTGVIVTDHNWGGNTAVDRSLPWEEWLDTFFRGYDNAKAEGDKIGLDVFMGYEAGYGGPEFLVYGLTVDFMKKHPELKTATPEELRDLIHSQNGLMIQPHPFREASYISKIVTYENVVDGFEYFNASHAMPEDGSVYMSEFDRKSIDLATKNNLPGTAGSDQHMTEVAGGGIAFRTPLTSIHDFISRIKNREDYVMTNGRYWFTKEGQVITKCHK